MGGVLALVKDGHAIANGLRANVTITASVLQEACRVVEDMEAVAKEFRDILAVLGAVTSCRELFSANSEGARQFMDGTVANAMRYVEEQTKHSMVQAERMREAVEEALRVVATAHAQQHTDAEGRRQVDEEQEVGSDESDWTTVDVTVEQQRDDNRPGYHGDRVNSTDNGKARRTVSTGRDDDGEEDGELMTLLSETVVSSCKAILRMAKAHGHAADEEDPGGAGGRLPLIAHFFLERFLPNTHDGLTSICIDRIDHNETEDPTDTVDMATAILMEIATIIESAFLAMETCNRDTPNATPSRLRPS